MPDSRRFLQTPYGAYFQRDIPPEDAELTHVGPGTPCGEYLRRFWQPVAYSHELVDLPRRIRIMGEDLVVFRDGRGRVGLLQLHCSHRGTSLEFGLVSERGIRCCYHGWLYDVDGRILETPGEPPTSTLKDRLCHGAYQAVEYKGLMFAYMGPPDRRPPFPVYDVFELPGYKLVPGAKHFFPCNWLQVKDNGMDPAHLSFLHTIVGGAQFSETFGVLSELDWAETPTGMVYIATRRVGENVWVRISDHILPNLHQFPPTWETATEERIRIRPYMSIWAVPIDDTNTVNFAFVHVPESMEVDEQRLRQLRESFGQTGERPYEERQRIPGDWDAQVSQRPIAIHALEHLASTDRGVILLRKLIRAAIRATRNGRQPEKPVKATGDAIPTYAQDTVLRIPPAPTPEADRYLLRETGRRVLAGDYPGRAG